MGLDVLQNFYQNDISDNVLSDVINFKDKYDFLRYAEQYLSETGCGDHSKLDNKIEYEEMIVDNEGWYWSKDIASRDGIEGRKVLAYKVKLINKLFGEEN
ncbi:hypothetical protein AAXE64_07980 [Priestia megaterium]